MYAPVVRFTGVDPQHLAGRLAASRGEASKGPPVDIPAVDSMDAADTPGTRASVDRCEIKVDLSPS